MKVTTVRVVAGALIVGLVGLGGQAAFGATERSVPAALSPGLGYDPTSDTGSLATVADIVGAPALWGDGYTGSGIGVAVIDTGVTRVPGLAASGQVIDGPDLSFDSQSPQLAHLDSNGHGTHMAGIIAGRDPGARASTAGCTTCTGKSGYTDTTKFVGIAPDAHVVNVKVGATDGAVDVSQVVAAIDWVVQHKDDPGLNIKVLSLSYGTNVTQPYLVDPLAYAAEVAWRNGIVVVAAGGNDGRAVPTLADPSFDPTLLAVGADDPRGTTTRLDDTVPDFATHGTAQRPVDVIAPGVSVISLRVPGSFVDVTEPGGTVGDRFQRGSGTSQATAVVSGMVALLRQRFPSATPDQVKALLMGSAYRINANLLFAGKGIVDGALASVLGVKTLTSILGGLTSTLAPAAPATGVGSLEGSRGDSHVVDGGAVLTGEQDIFGNAFDAPAMATAERARASWSGDWWNGSQWTGAAWVATDWAGNAWSGSRWRDAAWDGSRWRADWAGSRWRDASWSDATWSGSRWR